MTEERIEELLPFFAYIRTRELYPEKYGDASIEEWAKIFDDSPEDKKEILAEVEEFSDDKWEEIEKAYVEATTDSVPLAKEGKKLDTLKRLQSYKKGKSMAKKCSCGCDMVSKKLKGGKVVSKCSCGCKLNK